MNKKTIAMLIGLGLLGAIAAGAGVSKARKKKAAGKAAQPKAKEKPDTAPGMIVCPDCGNKFKEYEFFCPFCRRPAVGAQQD